MGVSEAPRSILYYTPMLRTQGASRRHIHYFCYINPVILLIFYVKDSKERGWPLEARIRKLFFLFEAVTQLNFPHCTLFLLGPPPMS